ncbi:hypothetical protein BGZ51_007593 [Haplosporangium sp. Z 767]|nr:hypothetical protein BGZ51_007593 [Haplosporangium sp. Z 767]
MELRSQHIGGYPDDSMLIEHRPYLWSVNVKQLTSCSECGNLYESRKVRAFTISGDGRYAATLASTDFLSLFLAVWDLRNPMAAAANSRPTNADEDQKDQPLDSEEERFLKSEPFQPQMCAWMIMPMEESFFRPQSYNLQVSLSWDASKLAVNRCRPSTIRNPRNIFSILYHDQGTHETPSSTPITTMGNLRPWTDYQNRAHLKDLNGCEYGVFHMTDNANPSSRNEFFIACDNFSVYIYKVTNQEWTHLHTIIISHRERWWCICGLQGRYMVILQRKYRMVSVWDIELGSMISAIPQAHHFSLDNTTVAFSNNGGIMAIYQNGRIALHWITTGQIFGLFSRPRTYPDFDTMCFSEDNTRILVTINNKDLTKTTNGLIIETSSMATVDEFFIPQACNSQISSMTRWCPKFYSTHEATLDHIPSYPHPADTCTDQCLKNLTPLSSSQHALKSNHPVQFTTASGLHYQLEQQGSTISSNCGAAVSVTISSEGALSLKRLVFLPTPSWELGTSIDYRAVLTNRMRLVLVSEWSIFVWRLPDSLKDDLKLDLVRTSDYRDRWMNCVHQELYCSRIINDGDEVEEEETFHVECHFGVPHHDDFQSEMDAIIKTYLTVEAGNQKALLQYMGTHINGCYDPAHPSDSLLATLCRLWTRKFQTADRRHEYGQLLFALLAFDETRWFLRPDTPLESNPLWILFEAAKIEPQIMLLSDILIDHCFERAGIEKDLGCLSTVLQCFHVLVNSGPLHADLANRILHRFTFFPVKARSYIVDHHTIAHPPEFQWWFWRPIVKPLYQCENPVLQLVSHPTIGPLNDNFMQQLHVAPFALLWRYKGDIIHSPDRQYVPRRVAPSWIRMLCTLIWHKCKLVVDNNVKCHDFPLDMLDNPAISALIEYKW